MSQTPERNWNQFMNKVQSALLCSGGLFFFFFVIHQEEEHRLENKANFTTHFGPVRKCNWSSEIGKYDRNKGLKALDLA